MCMPSLVLGGPCNLEEVDGQAWTRRKVLCHEQVKEAKAL
jgi:hypothetical protein